MSHVVPSAATKWYELGLQLLDPKYASELNTIEADGRGDAKTCCRKMFVKWLETDNSVSWNKVIKSLKAIELNNVASSVENLLKHGKPQVCGLCVHAVAAVAK